MGALKYDAVVVGAGPNGLAAAVVLARAGRSVLVIEAAGRVGGGARTAELTLPGFHHDVCSAIHPLGIASPLFRTLPLEAHGLTWVQPPAPLAHPWDERTAVMLERDPQVTAAGLGADGGPYLELVTPFLRHWQALLDDVLAPLRVPDRPLLLARFAWHALRSAQSLIRARFDGGRAAALFAGIANHSFLPLSAPPSAAFGMVLALAGHASGWPLARGGSGAIAAALAGYLRELGGDIVTDSPVHRLEEVPAARVTLLDLTPRQILRIAGDRLPSRYRRALERYRYGPGVFKVDWALTEPIPWRAPECARAATVHVIGDAAGVARATDAVWRGEHPRQPFVLLAQPTLFDPTRAPPGKHVAWAYCHVPHGSTVDMTARIEAQIDRYAPGFRDVILARSVRPPAALERDNANLIGGDISGGVSDLRQLFTRPVSRLVPYATPLRGVYICSSSTPPGGGVHGMCGYHAARAALRRELKT